MENTSLFNENELKAMGERTLDLLQASIDAGDKKTAKQLSQRMYNEFLAMHDLYSYWVTHLLTFIGYRYGDESLYEALKETVGGYTKRLSKRFLNKDIRRKIEMLVAGFRGHLHAFKIEEDDEKLKITVHPCGSGGRLLSDGAYDPPNDLLRIKKPQDMSFNRANFPVYCAHCYFQNTIEVNGKPLFTTEPADKLGEEPCLMYIYK